MAMLTCLVLLCAAIGFAEAAGKGYGNDWDYLSDSIMGPDFWKDNHTFCGGNRQSPINILTKDVAYNKLLGDLVLRNYTYTGSDIYYQVKNRNTDIAFEAKTREGRIYPPQEIDFKGSTYRFYQFHFHWGSVSYQGSEHLIDSQQFAAELHMIHYNTKYENVLKALKMSDGLLVWGHMLKVDTADKENLAMGLLFKSFKDAINGGKTKDIPAFSLYSLLPQPFEHYYHYLGSLTTPGCFESVSWIVNRNPISVSEQQMGHFRQLKDNAKPVERPLADNYRPAQDMKGRIVERNFHYGMVYSVAAITKPAKIAILAICLCMIYLF